MCSLLADHVSCCLQSTATTSASSKVLIPAHWIALPLLAFHTVNVLSPLQFLSKPFYACSRLCSGIFQAKKQAQLALCQCVVSTQCCLQPSAASPSAASESSTATKASAVFATALCYALLCFAM